MNLNYLVTGTGRCGTVYMARLLTSVGIPCGHESVFDWRGITWAVKRFRDESPLVLSHCSTSRYESGKWHSIPNWVDTKNLESESSYMAVPFLNEGFLADSKIIHVVRNPSRVVNSFCNYIDYFSKETPCNSYEQFIYRHLPELQSNMPQYDRASLFYVRWNQMIEESSPDLFHRVEDGSEPVLEFLNKTEGDVFEETNVNTFQKPGNRFSINQIESRLISDELINMGVRYGYNMKKDFCVI